MNLKEQICTIDQAKALFLLGLTQNSLFYYTNNWHNPNGDPIDDGEYVVYCEQQHYTSITAKKRGIQVEFVSAFTSAELAKFIPDYFKEKISFQKGKWIITQYWNGAATSTLEFTNEAQCRAELLMLMLKEKLETVEGCNTLYCDGYKTEF